MGDGRWEMGDGRWEMGDGRWEMGDGKHTAFARHFREGGNPAALLLLDSKPKTLG
jgi:hypothetical protein